MVGVIFLLYSEAKFDKEIIALLKRWHEFTFVQLPVLPTPELLLYRSLESDEPKSQSFFDAKREIIKETTEAVSKMKKDWNNNYVLYPIYFKEQLDLTLNRTYYLPLKFETPILDRFAASDSVVSLENFVRFESLVLAISNSSTSTSSMASTPSILPQ